MKKVRLLLLLCLSLLLAGCKDRGFQDIAVTSVRLVSIIPEGLTGVSAELEVGIHNPTLAFRVEDLTGAAKFQGQEALLLSAEPLDVAARCDSLYLIPLRGRVNGEFNPLRLLRLLGGDAGFDDITFDIRGRAALRSGLGKNIEMLDIPLSDLLGGTHDTNHEQIPQ